jgi:hypothetical protein
VWSMGGNTFSGDGARRGIGGSSPQPNVADWVYISATNAPTFTARYVAYYASPNSGILLDRIDVNGIPVWAVQSAGGGKANTVINSGNSLVFDAGNQSGQTAKINAATGVGQFAAVQSGTASNSDMAGQIAINGATAGSYSFSQAWGSAPICTASPTSDPTAAGSYWVTTSPTALTITIKNPATISFNYICAGRT